MSFTKFGLHPTLLLRLENLGYTLPAPAHAQLLPPMLKGDDVIASGPVGAGCTDAALFALLHRCLQSPDSDAACIILTPSESHTARIGERMQALAGNAVSVNIVSDSVPSPPPEGSAPLITISTVKNFLAQLRQSESSALSLTTLLFAEADEIIARGAKTALLELTELLNPKPQVLICTGRETRAVTRLSKILQREPARYTIKPDGEHPASIPQQAWPVPAHLKTSLLAKLQRRSHPASMLVITAEEETASRVARRLRTVKSSAAALLKLDSDERQNSLRSRFEASEIKLLLLSGRIPTNLPVAEVSHVINYDLPSDSRVYFDTLRRVPHAVHLSLVAPKEEERVLEIEDALGRPLFRDILPNFDYTQPAPKSKRTTRPEKKPRSSRTIAKPGAKKTDWDPAIPRTWGDRNAPRKDQQKIPLAEWSPEPLPAIWSEQRRSSSPTTPKRDEHGRQRRRRRGRRGPKNSKR